MTSLNYSYCHALWLTWSIDQNANQKCPIAEVSESNDPQNITEEPDTTRDEIMDKTLSEYTAAMATVKL